MKYIAIFLRKIGDSNFQKIGQKKFKPTDEDIRFRKETIKLPKNPDTYTEKRKTYLFIDFTDKKYLSFHKNSMVLDPKMLDKFIAGSIIGQLIKVVRASMEEPNKWKFMPFIITFIIGAVVGYLFGTNPAFVGG